MLENKGGNRYKHLLKNMLMLFAGSFASRILNFLLVPFYTSILSTSDYGTADLISTTVLLLLPLCSVLMDEAVMRFTLDVENDRKQVLTIAFTVSTLGFSVFLLLSPLTLLFESLRPYYAFVVLYYVVSWIYNIVSSYIRGMDRLAVTTTAGVLHTLVHLCLNIFFLAILKIGIYGYLLALNLSNAVAVIYMILRCKLYHDFIAPKLINKHLTKRMIRYSVPLIPDYISWWVNNASDRYVMTFFYGTSLTGIYSVAYKIPSLLTQMTSIFSSAWKISSVEDFGSEGSVQFYNRVYKLYSGTLMMGAAALIAITKLLASLLFAKDFFLAWRITPFLILAYCFSSMAQYVGSIFAASKQTKKLFYSSLCGAIVNLGLNIALIPLFQGIGAAVATVVGYVTIWTVNMINTRELLKMDFNLQIVLPAAVLLLGEIVGLLLDKPIGYALICVCAVLVFILNRIVLTELAHVLMRKIKHILKRKSV